MPSTWTTTLPTGSTRIRLAPAIFQDRWLNIEQGEVPSDKWQLQRQAGNPTSVANSGLIYTKDGGSSTSELFYEDDSGTPKIIQLTKSGGIGAPAQAVYGSTYITLQSDNVTTFTNTQDGFCSAAGRIAGNDGSLQAAYKVSSSVRNSEGNYSVFYSTNMQTAEGYSIQVTPRDTGNSSDAIVCNVITQAANRFTVKFHKYNSTTKVFDNFDCGFMFAVFMSRI